MTEEQAAPQQVFDIQRIYLKDSSFESPQAPVIFTKELNLSTGVELNTASRKLGDDVYEVELNITVTVKQGEDVAYLVEVKEAGIFTASGFEPEQMGHMLGSYCPNVLYPFAREVISDLAVKGGFPQLLLAPVNFDLLYAQHLQQQAQAAGETAEESAENTTH